MTLADAIGWILGSIEEPLGINELKDQVNSDYLGEPVDGTPVDRVSLEKCLERHKNTFDYRYGIVTLENQSHPADEFEKNIYDVLDIMRGHFKMDVAALLILPQVFVFRLHKLAQEDQLPSKFRSLKLEKMKLHNITDLCDIMNRIDKSDIDELSGSMQLFLNEFEALIGEEVFEKMFKRLKKNQYSINFLNEKQFGALYSDLIKNIFGDSHHRGEYLTSKFIDDVFSSIKFSPGRYKVLDPTFGVGASTIKFISSQREGVNIDVYGYEMKEETFDYAVMNLISNGVYSFNLKHEDCFNTKWPNNIDLILSDPPIGGKRKFLSFEQRLITKSRLNLKSNGRACILASNRFLYNAGEPYQERKQLVNQNILKKVISLPHGIGKVDSNIPISVLFIENRKSIGNGIEFYDFETSFDPAENDIQEYASKLFSPIDIESDYYQKVTNDDVIAKDYNLLPKRYVGRIHKKVDRLKKENRVTKLNEILTGPKGRKPSARELEKYADKVIINQDLKEDPFDAEINIVDYNSNHDPNSSDHYALIEESVLLISRIGEEIRPTYIHQEANPFLIGKSIWAFKITGEIIREYLLYQLHSSFFREQLKRIQTGSEKFTYYKDFLNLYIKVPVGSENDYESAQREYLEEKKQEVFEKAYREKKEETEKLKKQIDSVKHEESVYRDIEEEELIEYMNHNVRNKLSPVKDSVELIYDFMRDNEGSKIDLSAVEGEPLEGEKKSDLTTIDDLFQTAKRGINNALQSLQRLEDFRLNEYKPEDFQEVNLYQWFKDEVEALDKEYEIAITTKEVNPEEVFNIEIVVPAIRDLIDNLTKEFKVSTQAQLQANRIKYEKSKNPRIDESTIIEKILQEFELIWSELGIRLKYIPGKAFLSMLNTYLQEKYSINISQSDIIISFHKTQIPEELKSIFSSINDFRNEPLTNNKA